MVEGRVLLGAALGAALSLCSLRAEAQRSDIATPAFSLERMQLAPGPGNLIATSDAEVLGKGKWSFGVMGSLLSRPIVLRDLRTREEALVPVSLRLGYEFTVARGITRRFQLGIALPIVAAQEGVRLQGIGLSEESLQPVALGDFRIHGKLRLGNLRSTAWRYGLDFSLGLPSGEEEHFAGEAGGLATGTFLAAFRRSRLRIAGNLGLRLRTEEVAFLSPARAHGHEFIVKVAGEYRLPASWDFPIAGLAELVKVYGNDSGPSPGELRVGVLAYIRPRTRLKIIAGGGFTPDEVGAPDWRFALAFEFVQR